MSRLEIDREDAERLVKALETAAEEHDFLSTASESRRLEELNAATYGGEAWELEVHAIEERAKELRERLSAFVRGEGYERCEPVVLEAFAVLSDRTEIALGTVFFNASTGAFQLGPVHVDAEEGITVASIVFRVRGKFAGVVHLEETHVPHGKSLAASIDREAWERAPEAGT